MAMEPYQKPLLSLRQMPFKRITAYLNQTITKFANAQRTLAKQRDGELENTIRSLRQDLQVQNVRSKKAVEEMGVKLASSEQKVERMLRAQRRKHVDLEKSLAKFVNFKEQTAGTFRAHRQKHVCLEKTIEALRAKLASSEQRADRMLHAHRQKHECETLYADGHILRAARSLLDITRSITDDVRTDSIIMDWLHGFANKCIIALEESGDESSRTGKHAEALDAYTIALLLAPSTPSTLLNKWAGIILFRGSTEKALDEANKFKLPGAIIYRALCDVLERGGRVTEAVECFHQMHNELASDTSVDNEHLEWELDFQQRCRGKLERLADNALDYKQYIEADEHFSTILSLDPPDRVGTLLKQSKARALIMSWEEALKDVDEAIELDPSSYLGYEQRHATLHGAGRYAEAVTAFDAMLSKLKDSPDLRVRELRSRYTDARPMIRRTIKEILSQMPLELIDAKTGRLLDRKQQAEAFEAESIFSELVSSMTTRVNDTRIREEVKNFYRYAMLSHRWQPNEVRYRDVKNTTVSELRASSPNKLQAFCSLVLSLGFRWAWSDTCCIDQESNTVLQESLISMFTWYRGSSLTIVYLHDVPSKSLWQSIWNTRTWTYQEYVAAETIQFYTKDWEPYLGLELWNHKESPAVISEMERASQVSAAQLAALQPGNDRPREKLFLASTRKSTRVEDIAYSLLGIFKLRIPIIYGEGTDAVGRFLGHVLNGSRDVSILAWTGASNEYNSCLPLNLTVYNPLVPPHIPCMETAELDAQVSQLNVSTPDADALFEQLSKFPSASLGSGRLELPCIHFHITSLVHFSGPDEETGLHTYHVTTAALGDIVIRTRNELGVESEHCLVHPWIRPLLDQEYARGSARLDVGSQALRMVVRVRQPFGALLLEKVSRVEYKRVAADGLIKVRIHEEVPLSELIENIETVEVK